MLRLSYFNAAWTWKMRGGLIDADPLVQHSANALGFVNLIKAVDNNSLPWVINVVFSHTMHHSLSPIGLLSAKLDSKQIRRDGGINL